MNTVYYKGAAEAEDAMAVMARWISGNRKIQVQYHNGTAVDADVELGIIRIPRIACASGITQEALMMLRGRVYHEAGHVDESRAVRKVDYPKGAMFSIWNMLEDTRMELVEAAKHPGAELVFNWNQEYYNKDIAGKVSQGEINAPLWEALCAMMFQTRGRAPLWTLKGKAKAYFGAAYDEFIKVRQCRDAKDALELAKKIYDILKQVNEKIEQEKKPQDQQDKGEQGKQDQQDKGEQGKQGKQEKQDKGEQQDDGEPQGGSAGDMDDDDEGDDGEKSGEKSGEGGEKEDGEEKGGEAGGEGDEGDEKAGEGKGEQGEGQDDGEKADGDEGEQGEGKGAGKGDEGDEADGEGKGKGEGSDDAQGEADGAGEGGDEAGKGGKEDGDAEQAGSNGGPVKPGDSKYSMGDEEVVPDGRTIEQETEGGVTQEQIINEKLEALFKDMDPADLEYISRRDLDEHYYPDTVEDDKTEFKSECDDISVAVAGMTQALQQALRSLTRCRRKPYLRRGRIDHKRLVAIAKGLSKEVFFRKQDGMDMEVAVSIVIDESGSMGNYMDVRMLAIAIGEALQAIGVPFSMFGATTSVARFALDGFSRTNPIVYKHYKDFGETWTTVRHRLVKTGNFRNNVDGEVVEYAAFEVAKRKERRKVVFSLSDGRPCAGHGNDELMAKNLKRVCARARENGIEVFGFGVGVEGPKYLYGEKNFVFLNTTKDMGPDFVRKVADVVTGGAVKV